MQTTPSAPITPAQARDARTVLTDPRATDGLSNIARESLIADAWDVLRAYARSARRIIHLRAHSDGDAA
jgi:hypothetical protein